ncbi:MAG: CBS domain-containing protein [Gammaproteobacteria bacterium]|nr:CBS domain-containing protein [Gammaproteobacteria bacterium]
MIEGVLAVSDKKVRDIMVPRPQMVVVEGNAHPLDILPTIIQSQHSRFPITEENHDKVLGILLAKDLLPYTIEPKPPQCLVRDLVRPAIFIPESKPLDLLLKEFRLKHNHMAIVVNEYGGIAGLVTIEDVLEQIVGDIEDEYDVDEKETAIKETEKNIYLVNALTPIDDFNDYFNMHLSVADFDTIGGLVLQKFGYLPKRNETIAFDDFEVLVLKATRRGVQLLQFKRQGTL